MLSFLIDFCSILEANLGPSKAGWSPEWWSLLYRLGFYVVSMLGAETGAVLEVKMVDFWTQVGPKLASKIRLGGPSWLQTRVRLHTFSYKPQKNF